MKALFIGSFDPISNDHIQYALELIKKHKLSTLYLCPFHQGHLDIEKRLSLMKLGIQHYKKLKIAQSIGKDDVIFHFDKEEDVTKAIQKGNFSHLSLAVRKRILQEGWYFDAIAKNNCQKARYEHTLRVADVCVKLAKAHNVDPLKAYKAGLLHDVTKAYSDEKNRKIIALYRPEWLDLSPKIYHSFTATIFCKQKMDYHEEDVLRAMEQHTLGRGKSPLSQILYIADKIEPGRGYDTSYHMALALKDLKLASEYIYQESIAYRKQRENTNG